MLLWIVRARGEGGVDTANDEPPHGSTFELSRNTTVDPSKTTFDNAVQLVKRVHQENRGVPSLLIKRIFNVRFFARFVRVDRRVSTQFKCAPLGWFVVCRINSAFTSCTHDPHKWMNLSIHLSMFILVYTHHTPEGSLGCRVHPCRYGHKGTRKMK
eukprot:9470199-Pyramimonas_sp.AAC.3